MNETRSGQPPLRKRALALFAALIIIISASGCSVADPPPLNTDVPVGSAPDLFGSSDSEPVDIGDPAPAESTPEQTSSQIHSSESALSDTPDTSPEEPTVSSSDPVESSESEPDVTEPQPPQTTATTQKPTPQTTTTTEQKPEPKPPAKVVIPDIRVPSSPGTSVAKATGLTVDYSNAAKGYISVTYSGSSDKIRLRLVNGSVTYDHTITSKNTEYIPLSLGNGTYSVQCYERVDGNKYAQLLDTSLEIKVADELGMYLYPNRYVDFAQNSACVKKGAELCAGDSSDIDKIAHIFEWVSENITYDYDLAASVTSGYIPQPDNTLKKGSGICFDYAALVASMTRSQGIPTRLVIGYAGDIYHAWNEVWTEETGWIVPELLLAKKGYTRIDATFYSSSGNKKKISDFIADNGNYSAIYYY